MKSLLKRISGIDILFVIVIVCLTFQWFNYFPLLKHRTIFIGLGFLLVVFCSKGYFGRPTLICMLSYILMVLLNWFAGDKYFDSLESIVYIEFFSLFFSSAFVYYLFKYNKNQLFTIIILTFGIFLIHSTIISYLANQIMPGLMRFQANADAAQSVSDFLYPYRRLGLSDYLIPHALCVIIPGFVYLSKQARGGFRYFFIILTATAWILSFVSGAFAALLLSTLSLILSLLVNPQKSKSTGYIILFAFILVVPLLLSKDLQMSILDSIGSILPEESIGGERIMELQMSLESGWTEGDVAARQEKLSYTLAVVENNFILGTDSELIGGHNALIDRLAALGIIGMIPFFLFLHFQLKFILNYITGIKRLYLYIGITCGLLMMLSKNMYTWSMWLFLIVLLPGMLYLGDYSKKGGYQGA